MNKVYFFIVDEDYGGVYVAAKNWKEARKYSMQDELISEYMEEFIDLRGSIVKPKVFTTLEGVLSIEQTIKLGLAWWDCENDSCIGGEIEFVDELNYRCSGCGEINKIPYVNM